MGNNDNMGIKMLALVLSFGFLFFTLWLTSDDKGKSSQASQQVSQIKKSTDYQGKLDEMIDSFNKVQSQVDSSVLYSGCTMRTVTGTYRTDILVVYVNPYWFNLNDEVKKGYINQCYTLWAGMTGARQIKFIPDTFELEFVYKPSGAKVATWDSTWGSSIKK